MRVLKYKKQRAQEYILYIQGNQLQNCSLSTTSDTGTWTCPPSGPAAVRPGYVRPARHRRYIQPRGLPRQTGEGNRLLQATSAEGPYKDPLQAQAGSVPWFPTHPQAHRRTLMPYVHGHGGAATARRPSIARRSQVPPSEREEDWRLPYRRAGMTARVLDERTQLMCTRSRRPVNS